MDLVFCIGLPKTGTTSLKRALGILGFDVNRSKPEKGLPGAFVGDFMCIPLDRWKGLYGKFPDAKFILTYRPPEDWWQSLSRWAVMNQQLRVLKLQRKRMYGHAMPDNRNKVDFMNAYNQRYKEVTETIPDVLVFEPPFEWEPLCEYLDVDCPDEPYPVLNASR